MSRIVAPLRLFSVRVGFEPDGAEVADGAGDRQVGHPGFNVQEGVVGGGANQTGARQLPVKGRSSLQR